MSERNAIQTKEICGMIELKPEAPAENQTGLLHGSQPQLYTELTRTHTRFSVWKEACELKPFG